MFHNNWRRTFYQQGREGSGGEQSWLQKPVRGCHQSLCERGWVRTKRGHTGQKLNSRGTWGGTQCVEWERVESRMTMRFLVWVTRRKHSLKIETRGRWTGSERKMNSHLDMCWSCLLDIQIKISSRQEYLWVESSDMMESWRYLLLSH